MASDSTATTALNATQADEAISVDIGRATLPCSNVAKQLQFALAAMDAMRFDVARDVVERVLGELARRSDSEVLVEVTNESERPGEGGRDGGLHDAVPASPRMSLFVALTTTIVDATIAGDHATARLASETVGRMIDENAAADCVTSAAVVDLADRRRGER